MNIALLKVFNQAFQFNTAKLVNVGYIASGNIKADMAIAISILSFVFISIVVLAILLYRNVLMRKKIENQLHLHQNNLEEIIEQRTSQLKIEISERKLAEESDKLKSAFLTNMSHELRTPMNAIMAFSALLENQNLPANKQKEYIRHIGTAGKNLMQIINDIIDSAKIEARELKISPIKTNVNELLMSVQQHFIGLLNARESNINFKLNLPDTDNKDIIIDIDPIRLRQIINNLLENASRYTEEGSIEAGFQLKKDKLEFFIKDTGKGIPEDKTDYIFDRFTRYHQENKTFYSGSGLGLSITKNLIQLMNGSISVISEKNKGSEFTFNIPYQTIEYKERANENLDNTPKADFDKYCWNEKTILIAEDEDLNFKVLESALSRTKAHIIRAINGEEATKICTDKKVDIVLMDIQMPVKDGFQATREIKQLMPDLPIVAQTSFALNGEKKKCIDAGCNDFLTKPINLHKLLSTLNHYLDYQEVK